MPHLGIDTKNCHIVNKQDMIGTIGVEDLIIMRIGKTTVVAKNNNECIEQLIVLLKKERYGRRKVIKELERLLTK
jgi:hypothetical protein